MQKIVKVEKINNISMNYENVINKLKASEKEIENGEGIESDIAFKELRQKFGY